MCAPRNVLMVAVALAVTGCKKEGSTGPGATAISGSWTATSVQYVNPSYTTVDVIALGGTATLVLGADSSFVYTYTPQGGSPQVTTARWEMVSADLMRVTPTGATWYWAFDVALSGNTLTLRGGQGEYDFNNDHQNEPCTWNMVLTR